MLTALLLLVIFVLLALLMYLGRLPALLALPLLALGVVVVGGVPWQQVVTVVFSDGAFRLASAMAAVLMGAILAQLVDRTGIARVLVTRTAELGGDRPLPLALLLTLVVALLFTTLGGLGAVIMVATIIFPILLSIGLPPLVVGCLFLFGMSLGGVFNIANWQVYKSILGLDNQTILTFAVPLAVVLGLAFALVGTRQRRRLWAAPPPETRVEPVRWFALLTPLVPLVPVLAFAVRNFFVRPEARFEFPIITALLVGIAYGLLATWRRDRSAVQLLSRSVIEGIAAVAPALALMVGIGMVVNAMAGPPAALPGAPEWKVAVQMRPLLLAGVPSHPLPYVLVFGVLAPLALYRGPLNLWGMGSGLVAAILAAGALPPAAIMAAFFSVGLLQGVSDPTNTHNVWIANNLSLDVQRILRVTLPYVWVSAVVALAIGAALFLR